MIYSIVDLGSNTIRLSVYQCKDNGFQLLFHKKVMAGLAGYVEEGVLSVAGIELAISTLKDFQHIVETFEMGTLSVFATASLRNIKNSRDVVEEIQEKTNLTIDLITGKQEAKYDFIGVLQNKGATEGLIIDIGGGSTELVVFENETIKFSTSLPIGSLMLWHKFVKDIVPTKKEIKQMKAFIEHELVKNKDVPRGSYPKVFGVGGTIRACNKINNAWYENEMNNELLTRDTIKNIIQLYKNFSNGFVQHFIKVAPERVHSFIPGVLILREIVKYFDCKDIEVSSFGVREGYLLDKVLPQGETREGKEESMLSE